MRPLILVINGRITYHRSIPYTYTRGMSPFASFSSVLIDA